MGFRTQRKSAKITEKISKALGVDFEKVDLKIIIFQLSLNFMIVESQNLESKIHHTIILVLIQTPPIA